MEFRPRKPSARDELIGRLSIVALALLLIAVGVVMIGFCMIVPLSLYSLVGILSGVFLCVAAVSMVGLTFAPKGNSRTGQSTGFELVNRIMDGLSTMIMSILELISWFVG